MPRLNAKQMEVFAAVMSYGSITAAAQHLNVSQPAVSRMVERFELEAGFVAFIRRRGKLVPTPEAEIFFAEVRQVYQGLDYLNEVAREIGGTRRGYLRIGVFPAYAGGWIGKRLARYLEGRDQLFTSVMPMSTDSVVDAIGRQAIDLGIAMRSTDRDGVRSEPIRRAEMVCILPPGHRLKGTKRVSPADLSAEDCVAMADRTSRARIDSIFNSAGIERRIRAESPWASSVCHLVAQGIGYGIVIRDAAEEFAHLGFHICEFEARVEYTVFLITSTARPLSAAADAFRQMLLSEG
ncbi:LysR substrate-binding domain-containing protein [Burkholderia sp. 3C]